MAETVKILSPDKTVYLSNKNAGCPMAEMMDKDLITEVKKQYPDLKPYELQRHLPDTADVIKMLQYFFPSS